MTKILIVILLICFFALYKLHKFDKHPRDYQLEVKNLNGDISVWDGKRRLGVLEYSDSSDLFKLLNSDTLYNK